MEWINYHLLFLIVHVFGVALGAGAAFTGDFIFLSSVRDSHLSKSESRIMGMASRIVWVGVIILVISGIGLVMQRSDIFLHSGKFLAKMSIVGVIVLNGLAFRLIYGPIFKDSIGKEFSSSSKIISKRAFIVASGAISAISWSFTIVLGVLGRVPFSFYQIMSLYIVILVVGICAAIMLKSKIIPAKKS